MNKHDGCERGFYWCGKAWYANANLEEAGVFERIMIGMYAPEGGSSGEFSLAWHGVPQGAVRLEVFDDAWDALQQFGDLLVELAKLDNMSPSPKIIIGILKRCGIKDLTPYVRPE